MQQAANAEEVSKAIQGVSAVTEQAAAGSEQMASSSQQLGAQAATLRDLVSEFRVSGNVPHNGTRQLRESCSPSDTCRGLFVDKIGTKRVFSRGPGDAHHCSDSSSRLQVIEGSRLTSLGQ